MGYGQPTHLSIRISRLGRFGRNGEESENGPRVMGWSVNSIENSRGLSLDQKEFVAVWQAKPLLFLLNHESVQ